MVEQRKDETDLMLFVAVVSFPLFFSCLSVISFVTLT